MKLLKKKSVEDIAEELKRKRGGYLGEVFLGWYSLDAKKKYEQVVECKDIEELSERRILPSGWNKYNCSVCGEDVYTIIDTEHKDEYGDSTLVCHACILEMNTAWKEGHL